MSGRHRDSDYVLFNLIWNTAKQMGMMESVNQPARRSGVGQSAIVLLGIVSIIWGTSFLMIKIALTTLPPLTVTTARAFLAALFLGTCVRIAGTSFTLTSRICGLLFSIGMFGNALPFTLLAWGEQYVSSGQAAILLATIPLFTMLLAHFVPPRERLSSRSGFGILSGFAGILAIMSPRAVTEPHDVIGPLVIICAAMAFAIAILITRCLPQLPISVAGAAIHSCAAMVMLPLWAIIDRPWTIIPSLRSIIAVVFLGLFCTALTSLLYIKLISLAGATFASLNNYLVPIVGLSVGAIFLRERITHQDILLILIVTLSVLFISKETKTHKALFSAMYTKIRTLCRS